MQINMGLTDRVLRFIAAAVFLFLYFTGTIGGTLGIVLLVVSVVFLLTSLVSFCPLYTLLGISTCKIKK